ncbi:sugar phosphate isomerase/epimerase family protein [Clostridium thailandense]|uniref:sugar phosphate isomerase/epimerase family protein n=1 Tax=Clostridium thailandense TaxID=2794346 RepID=UPI003988F52C
MEIGLSSASFYPNLNIEDTISLMKKLGFDVGELFLNTASEYDEEFIKLLIEEKDKSNFRINSVHGFSSSFEPFLFDVYKRRRDDMFIYFKKICKAAKMLGAQSYTFHGMRYQKSKYINLKFIVQVYNELIYTAMEEGIKLSQENVSWCMSSDIDFLKMLKEECKYPIHFTFDIKQSYKAGIEPEKYIDIMGRDIINLHINDRDDVNLCLLPGKGNVNYKKLFKKLKENEYNGIGIIEVYSDNYSNYDELTNAKKILTSYF